MCINNIYSKVYWSINFSDAHIIFTEFKEIVFVILISNNISDAILISFSDANNNSKGILRTKVDVLLY